MIGIVRRGHASQADSLEKRRYEPMKEYNEKTELGQRLGVREEPPRPPPQTDEVWEADIQPISVWGSGLGEDDNRLV